MSATTGGPATCPLVSPYHLPGDQLTAYLDVARGIHTTGRYRSLAPDSWSERAARFVHGSMGLPEDWSVLPLRSGTDALVLALVAAGVVAGDEVAVPDLAFEAVAMAVLRIGAVPVFVDVDEHTWNLSEATLAEFRGRGLKAVIAVDNFGAPCDWQGIRVFCANEGIPLIVDACEALGATYPGGARSDFAHFVACSFSFTKPIHAAGMGGALCAPSVELKRLAEDPRFALWPTRLPELNAAFLVHAAPELPKAVAHLNEVYRRYAGALGAVPQELVKETSTATWIFAPLKVPAGWKLRPSALVAELRAHGIVARQAFQPQSERFGLGPARPVSARLHQELICLPTGASMPLEWVDTVIERVSAAVR